MLQILFSSATRIRSRAEKQIEQYSQPDTNFLILINLASAIITAGLILDNTAIIIGGMVVAPLITPFFAVSLSIILLQGKLLLRSLLSIIVGSISVLITSATIGYFVILLDNREFINTVEILSRTQPNLLYFLVAILSGVVGAYAYVHPKLSEKIIGIAIAAAVVPPLAVIGLGISKFSWQLIAPSSLLFIINLLGIIFGSMITFLLFGFGKDGESILKK